MIDPKRQADTLARALGAAGLALGLLALIVALLAREAPPEDSIIDVLRCRRLEVMNTKNAPAVVVKAFVKTGNGSVEVMGGNGRVRVTAGSRGPNGKTGLLVVHDSAGKGALVFTTMDKPGTGLARIWAGNKLHTVKLVRLGPDGRPVGELDLKSMAELLGLGVKLYYGGF